METMINTYNVEIDRQLSALFRQAFDKVAKAQGYEALMKLAAPDTAVWEYQRGDHIISLHTHTGEKRLDNLKVECLTLHIGSLIAATLKQLLLNQAQILLAPLKCISKGKLHEGLNTLFQDLGFDSTDTH